MQPADILLAFAASGLVSSFALPQWIKRATVHKLLITDVQKIPPRPIPYLAGLIVASSAVIGTLLFIAQQTFIHQDTTLTVELLAGVSSILIALIIGVVDDLLGQKIGLSQAQKPILCLFAAIPIIVINAGRHMMTLPFIGPAMLGNAYPFLIIPLAITGAANGYNMLAGINGLEAGQGLIILSTLGYLSWISGASASATIIAACMVGAILPFFLRNKYPAQILPGNGFTYSVGATIAIVAIMGDLERSAVILFIPYFIEFILKARGRFKKESLARPLPNGSLKSKYAKWYSLNHISISTLRKLKGKAFEWEVTMLILGFELIFAAIAIFPYVLK